MKLFFLFALFTLQSCISNQSGDETNPRSSIPKKVIEEFTEKVTEVKKGEGLFQVFDRLGVSHQNALKIINSLRDEVEISKIQVGDKMKTTFDSANSPVQVEYIENIAQKHIAKKVNNRWVYEFVKEKLSYEFNIIEGLLGRNKTLEEELKNLNVHKVVAGQAINVLGCKINFRQYARQGDKFKLFIRSEMFEDKIIKQRLLFASYSGKTAGNVEAFYYSDGQKDSTYNAYYTKSGEALIRSGLRFPLSRMHVRSNFGWRVHPVTGRRAFHRGVDLRARTGKAVYSVSSGKVLYSSYSKFAGNKIGLKHRDGSSSHYYHLKKRYVKKGDWVKTRQKIGSVGSTGRVTGAHLHFGFKNSRGKWINPLNKRMIASPKLKGSRLSNLNNQISVINKLIKQQNNLDEIGELAFLDD